MDNSDSFDLNRAVQRWRETLAQAPAFRSENLDELESHLRDSLAMLQTRGLTTEEAFLLAARRLGRPEEIGSEFGKVNRGSVWRQRGLWMLAGMLFFMVGWDLSRLAAAVVTWLGSLTATNGLVLGWFSAATKLLTLGLIITLFGLLIAGKLSRWTKGPVCLQLRPVGSAILVLGGMLLLKLATGGLEMLGIRNLGPQTLGQTYAVTMWFNALSPVLVLVVMVGLLSRLLSGRSQGAAGRSTAAWILVPFLAMSLVASSAQAQTNAGKAGDANSKPSASNLDQVMKLWNAGKKEAAATAFMAVDFSRRPLFPSGSVLNYTEPQFMALPRAAAEKLSKQMLEDISGLKGICALVRDTGRSALDRGDKAAADKCTMQLKKCGDALNQPDSLALLKLVGKAVHKMAAEPAAAPKK
jgi:hypothetical protein